MTDLTALTDLPTPAAGDYFLTWRGVAPYRLNWNLIAAKTSNGNMVFGSATEGWYAGASAIKLRTGGLAAYDASNNNQMEIGSNYYQSGVGAYNFANTGKSRQFILMNDQFRWSRSNAGTVGGSISYIEDMRLDDSGNLGIGTSSPTGKLSVASPSSAAGTIPDWSKHSVFGPNSGSNSGSAIGIGYNTSANQSEIASIAPGVAWRKLAVFCDGFDLYSKTGLISVTFSNTGALGLSGSLTNSGAYNSTYHQDTTPATQSVANNGTIDISNFSGFLMINNHTNGAARLFACGAGTVADVGGTGTMGGTVTYVAGINGYRFTNTSGATANFGMCIFRTRTAA